MSSTDLTAVITGIKLYADKGTSVAGETDAEAGNLPYELDLVQIFIWPS